MAIKTFNKTRIFVKFEEAANRQQISSNESINTTFGKIAKFFSDLKAVAFSGSYKDLLDKPTVEITQAEYDALSNDKKNDENVVYFITDGKSGGAGIDDDKISTDSTWSSANIQIHLEEKVSKVDGKGLSTNDYTNEDKSAVDGVSDINGRLTKLEDAYVSGETTYDNEEISNSVADILR